MSLADESKNYIVVAPREGATASAFFSSFKHRTAIIRTSDRMAFRNCRRRWAWSSHLMQDREPFTSVTPLWYGSGIHYALEDMFGWKQFEFPEDAFKAYVKASYRYSPSGMPADWKEHLDLGIATLRYFRIAWLSNRSPLRTYVHEGVPQVEVNFLIDVPFDLKKFGYDQYYDKVLYAGTIDRVIVDDYDRLWLVDYKTAKNMKVSHFENDSQVTSYLWAAQKLYGRPVEGMVYWQFSKDKPSAPRQLNNGSFSVAKNQSTTRILYKLALIRGYGSIAEAPQANQEFLNYLGSMEDEDFDRYIRRDWIKRNPNSQASEGTKILLELEDMLNPDLPLYPNPTFLCPGNCSYYEPCVSIDDGSDWQQQLEGTTQVRTGSWDAWRTHLKIPGVDDEPEEYEPWNEPVVATEAAE